MGLFDIFKKNDINGGVNEFRREKRAMLIDVREPGEYNQGHIFGARNIPLSKIENVKSAIHDKDMPIYLYCQRGSRSNRAASAIRKMGYTNVHSIGGIESYFGKLER